jgi:hypothetical protein
MDVWESFDDVTSPRFTIRDVRCRLPIGDHDCVDEDTATISHLPVRGNARVTNSTENDLLGLTDDLAVIVNARNQFLIDWRGTDSRLTVSHASNS